MRTLTNVRFVRFFLFAVILGCLSAAAFAQVGIAISFGPPALPIYEQPPCPQEGYMWTPGYWAYDYDISDYYWVPGTWIESPEVGFLWTPGYWGWNGGGFIFNEGYWGPHVGFYGGISYGYGYFGEGYEGGRWDNGRFFYNRSVNNVNVTNIHNVYNTTVINNTTTINRVSYNGGNGGLNARPRAEDEIASRDRHVAPVSAQTQHLQAARANPQMRASENHGKPAIAATPRAGAFTDRAVAPAKEGGAPYTPPANRRANASPANAETPRSQSSGGFAGAAHAKDVQPHARPDPPNTGNTKADQKYQQQQQKLYARQEQDHQKLQQRQEQDHQKLERQQAPPAKNQQVEQRHQQQTQQMEQKHTQQQERIQPRQQPPNRNEARPPEKK